jgi:tetratricopeptide (TPR) repeat protein
MKDLISQAAADGNPLPGRWVFAAVLIAITLLNVTAFFPSLHCGFTNWDDDRYVTNNFTIRDLSPHNLSRILTKPVLNMFTPLVILSFAVEYHFWGLNPFPYHLDNLILHCINSILVFWLIFLISGDFTASLVATLLFALSPLRVQSVAWVVERKGLLCALFFFSSFIAYIYSVKRSSRLLYGLSLFFFVLSFLSKAQGTLLLFVLIMYDWLIAGKLDRRSLIAKLPYLAGFVIAGLLAWMYMYTYANLRDTYSVPLFKGLFLACYIFLFYVWKIAAPFDLHEIYPLDMEFIRNLPITVWLSPVIILILAALLARPLKRLRRVSPRHFGHVVFGLLLFTLFLAPSLRVLPLTATSLIGLRQTYIACLGLFLIAGEGFSWLYRKKKSKPVRFMLCLILAVVMITYVVSSFLQCAVWKDGITFWNHVIERYPRFTIALNNRGFTYNEKGDFVHALEDFNKVLALNPLSVEGRINLGNLYIDMHQYQKAKENLDFALIFEPEYATAYFNRGNLYQRDRDYDRAIEMYQKAIAHDPSYVKPYVNLGNIYLERGDRGAAIEEFNRAISINGRWPESYYNRGNVWFRLKEYGKAISDYCRAISLDWDYWDAHRNRALAYFMVKDYNSAASDVRALLSNRQTVDPVFLLMLDNASKSGRHED